MKRLHIKTPGWLLLLGALLSCFASLPAFAAPPLRVCATVPELGGLVRAVGGDQVAVTVFAKGTEDPHYLDAKPSFIKALSQADLFIQIGMDLEAGWAPLLLRSSRNARVQPGGSGFLDASVVITPLEVPSGPVDRSMGDIHPQGNPHYLADPLAGLKVAALIRDRLAELRPEAAGLFSQRYEAFRMKLAEAMVGPGLAGKFEIEKLALLYQQGRLTDFLRQQGDPEAFGGWLGRLHPFFGARILTYHSSWPYFAERFGLVVVGQLEPKPGIPPGPGHLLEVVRTAQAQKAAVILMEPWLSRKPADLVAEKTGMRVVQAATSVAGGVEGYDYLAALEQVVRRLADGLAGNARP
jgi:ABC-type Zn uptake system ZnuABC Zn-binding protein ZnuA